MAGLLEANKLLDVAKFFEMVKLFEAMLAATQVSLVVTQLEQHQSLRCGQIP